MRVRGACMRIENHLSKVYFKNKKILSQYLFSNIALFMIPIIILSFVICVFFIRTLKSNIETGNRQILEKTEMLLDSEIKQLYMMSNQVSINRDISILLTQYEEEPDNPLIASQIVSKFNDITVSGSLAYKAYLYLPFNNRVLSTSNSVSLEEFLSEILTDGEKHDIIRDTIVGGDNINYITDVKADIGTNVFNSIFFIFKKADMLPNSRPTVIFVANTSDMDKILSSIDGCTYVFEANGQPVHVTGGGPDKPYYDSVYEAGKNAEKNGRVIKLGKKRYFISAVKSKVTGFLYVNAMDSNLAYKDLNRAYIVYLLGFLAICLILAVFLPVIAAWQYKPILRIKEMLDINHNSYKATIEDELVLIKNAIENKQKLPEIASKADIKQYLIFAAIRGKYDSFEELNKDAAPYDFQLEKKYYGIAHLVSEREGIGEWTTEFSDADFDFFYINNFGSKTTVFCYGVNDNGDTDFITDTLEEIRLKIREKFDCPVTIGVGSPTNKTNELWKSYFEASTAIDYMIIEGKDKIICIYANPSLGGANGNEFGYFIPKEKLEVLSQYIKTKNTDKSRQVISEIIEDVKKQKLPLFVLRCVIYDMINIVIKSAMATDNVSYDNINFLNNLSKIETVNDLYDILEMICMQLPEKVQNKPHEPVEKIIEFIEQSFFESNFTVQSVAERFGMSPSTFSRYFKNEVGMTVTDYITKLQIKKAKSLLVESDIPIAAIAAQTGQFDTSSFIRKFKKTTGVTPGEFRRLYRKI